MSNPITGTNSSTYNNNALVTDVQGQQQTSGFITVFEVLLPESDIGGAGIDKLYFHDGANGTNDIQWYSLLDEDNFGSTNSAHYGQQTYSAFPVESDGWEVRGSGSLPRPTVKFANINQYWSAHLSNFDDLVGARVIRRRTLAKYLVGGDNAQNPPVEFNRDVYYIERKTSETSTIVEFELASAFDVQGIKLPRRSIVAARCPWKYKDTDQGGCDWPSDNRYTIDSTEYTLYFDKDDTRITSYATWAGQNDLNGTVLYDATSYSVGDYVEYYRPIGGLIAASAVAAGSAGTNEMTYTVGTGHGITAGEFVIAKGFTDDDANAKAVPLKVEAVTSTSIKVHRPDATITTSSGYLQATRVTLYKCITAHAVATSDDADDIIRPTNISYWEFGDVCGKRLNSCAIRYGHDPAGTGVTSIIVTKTDGNYGGGSGYTSAPTVVFSSNNVDGQAHGGSGAAATATINVGRVTKITMTSHGTGYTSAPAISFTGGGGSGAAAVANINVRGTRNVSLPFGGFPGAALY